MKLKPRTALQEDEPRDSNIDINAYISFYIDLNSVLPLCFENLFYVID